MRKKQSEEESEQPIPNGDEPLRNRLEGFVPDVLRRTFYAGLGAVFASEDGIRKLANDFSLPKDVAKTLVSQAQSTKAEFFRSVGKEVRSFLDNLDVTEEMKRVLTSVRLEIKSEIRFIPVEGKFPRPEFSKRTTINRTTEELPPVEEPAPAATEETKDDATDAAAISDIID